MRMIMTRIAGTLAMRGMPESSSAGSSARAEAVSGRPQRLYALLAGVLLFALSACEEAAQPASQTAAQQALYPEGRILTVNQDANTVSVIDVATDRGYTAIQTGEKPHHVLATPDSREFWVTLYGENRLQVFDSQTLKEIASVDVGSPNDDLVFDPEGARLYVSLGQKDEVAVIDVAARQVVGRVKVGKTPHGLRVTPNGKYLLATNTLENTVSLVKLEGEPAVEATIKTGANPFEVVVTDDSATAYVSNFLGDSISVVDLASRKTVGYIRSGKKPAMLAVDGGDGDGDGDGDGQQNIWVANTGSGDLWLIDAATRKLVTRIPVGRGAHGVLPTPSGKLYITNSEEGTVSVVDQRQNTVVATVPVGSYPNGLTFLPPASQP